ncbi:uncharacterized protein [Paralichthys olivaceus]|uniref:uncharacterized protein n=1 Tax=Paralichthys olivaceus TaxID=8255 RepID=UPI0037529387
MKMKTILVGLFLGLLAVVQATPVPTVTQIPAKAEDDVFREAVTDGFLVNHFFTTRSPKRNTTVLASQQPPSDPKEAVKEAPSEETTTAVFIQHGGDHDTTTTDLSTSSPSGITSSSVPNDAKPSTTTHISATHTADPAVSSFHFLSTLSSDSGSGDGEESDLDATTSSSTTPASNTESSTAASTSTAAFNPKRLFEDGEGSGSGSTPETSTASSTSTAFFIQSTAPRLHLLPAGSASAEELSNSSAKLLLETVNHRPDISSPQAAAKGTPGWIIIVGFIVGVAALVMLCVAIATRDKWNGPHQAQTKADSSNQQREQEMETFLHKETPRENGKSAEYTVIPLDELPESNSSH